MNKKRGFTLIELLVVIAIIGMLSAIVLASLNTARSKGADAARISNVKALETAMELYYNDKGTYPGVACGFTEGAGYLLGSLGNCIVPTYMSSMPSTLIADGDQYVYRTDEGGGYGLYIYTSAANQSSPYNGFCRTGVNINPGWWINNALTCSF